MSSTTAAGLPRHAAPLGGRMDERAGRSLEDSVRRSMSARRSADALEREALLDRLHQLRTVIPAFAKELADVRRAAAQLRRDNRRLLAEVHRLRRERDETSSQRTALD